MENVVQPKNERKNHLTRLNGVLNQVLKLTAFLVIGEEDE